VPEWTEAERLAREKELVGFFVSGHPLNRYAAEAALFGTHTTRDLGKWTDGKLAVAAVVTAVRRQIARKSGAEWAKLTIEDFQGTAECLAFPEAWSKLARIIVPDGAYVLTGGYSTRDRGEEDVPFIVEDAHPLGDLRAAGRIGLALRWSPRDRAPETARAVAALCSAHQGAAPVFLDWSEAAGDSDVARFRSRSLAVTLDDELLGALRGILGADAITLVKTG
jgi:DNA polymerase-3 subunit alpha